MQVTRFDSAKPYSAPGHNGIAGLRLQGYEASDAQAFWVGLSQFLPGANVERSATPLEKVYMVLEGELTFVTGDGEQTLGAYDSCWIAPGEARVIENRTNRPAAMLVMMPYPSAGN